VKACLFPGKDGKSGAAGGREGADGTCRAAPAKGADAKPAPGAVSKAGEAAR
jgi:hypothetical protein